MTTVRRAVTALLSAGICLLAAPVAHADLDDLLDTDIGPASAADVAGVPGDPAALDASGVLQDPLAQLTQLFRDAPPQPGSEPVPAGAPSGTAPTNRGDDAGLDDDSSSLPKLPKLSLPSTGNGSGGNGGGSGGSGSAAGHAKPKANASATKPHIGLPEIDGHG